MRSICKILLTFAIAILGISGTIDVYAASRTEIYADETVVNAGESKEIPVRIQGNNGIMGYVIRVAYEEDRLDVESISKGNVSRNGIFDSNLLEKKEKGSFDILWSYTKEEKEDGILFYLYIKTKKDFKGKTSIKLSYSQEDTFNEKYEDVVFACSDIIISSTKTKSQNKSCDSNSQISSDSGENFHIQQSQHKANDENQRQKKSDGIREEKETKTKNENLEQEDETNSILTKNKKNVQEPETLSGKSIKIKDVIQDREAEKKELGRVTSASKSPFVWIGILLLLVIMVLACVVKSRKRKQSV